ncbi:MAG: Qat anti-phage system QueC-like protein QatC [Hyphomonadaceae bacterium]
MKLICGPEDFAFPSGNGYLPIVVFGNAPSDEYGSVGAAVKSQIGRDRLDIPPRAWDFLAIAMSVVAADLAGDRGASPNGWTREYDVQIAVADPQFWNTQAHTFAEMLGFLTSDRWAVSFVGNGLLPAPPAKPLHGDEDGVVLLSGGLDSLTGAIDLAASGKRLVAVSKIVNGDREKQCQFAQRIAGITRHIQFNHNANVPEPEDMPTTRGRSIAFLAFGMAAATSLAAYKDGATVPLYICENGFIAINPPLTGSRLGSLSTRTAHPRYLSLIQRIFDAAGLRVVVSNPCAGATKGEMLRGCLDQPLLKELAAQSTSCGRFLRFGRRHCGRCVPCQIRRAAFLAWGQPDTTDYLFEDIGRNDSEHARYDDVRALAMAIAAADAGGLSELVAGSLNTAQLGDITALTDVVRRGLLEVKALHAHWNVR